MVFVMETKIKVATSNTPSSPREFFQRIYGTSNEENNNNSENNSTVDKSAPAEIITPVPILASPIPLFLPGASEAQLTAAAAGLSAFCKNFFITLYFVFVYPCSDNF